MCLDHTEGRALVLSLTSGPKAISTYEGGRFRTLYRRKTGALSATGRQGSRSRVSAAFVAGRERLGNVRTTRFFIPMASNRSGPATTEESASLSAAPPVAPSPLSAARESLDRRYAHLYEELRVLARRELRRSPALTLGTTGLVHESYLKLVDLPGAEWRSRGQFFVLAARAMRHILVDHARRRQARKRGGGALQVTLRPELAAANQPVVDVLALEEALARLGEMSERMERIVECRFFGGLSVAETAEALESSVRTVEREWTRARSYLYQLLDPDTG
jgi:RNA polymerase sigma factor (TIGR02999 family)